MLGGDQNNNVLSEVSDGVPNRIRFTAYGHRSAEKPVSTHIGYNGMLSEGQTGVQLLGNGYRAYSSVLMRFLGWDSWSPFGEAGFNGYGYGKGDPMNGDDPSGHMFKYRIYGRPSSPTPKTRPVPPGMESPSVTKSGALTQKASGSGLNRGSGQPRTNQLTKQGSDSRPPTPKPDYDGASSDSEASHYTPRDRTSSNKSPTADEEATRIYKSNLNHPQEPLPGGTAGQQSRSRRIESKITPAKTQQQIRQERDENIKRIRKEQGKRMQDQ
ncbi:hypothetical protein PS918_02556 [Pseudomonas fluorescens]|uniref:RHS repeat-associated core domain-containing protein n=1 Tax=Pseudomonas fluorescens TaxID=294 RepID=A0A5E7SC59_PSEFL|nr:RHS repeat-associated core domain-containing protein [Pseudomonas fluorescens]VVP83630.1 hypothetical protein PS918_02556 [Pseudomonas fluorescens]